MSGEAHETPRPGGPPARVVSRRRAAVVAFLFSYAGILFAVINGIVLVPFYLKRIDVATYGAWLASGDVVRMLGLFESGLTLVYTGRLCTAVGQGDLDRMARIVGSGAPLFALLVIALFCAGTLASPWVPTWVGATRDREALSWAFRASTTGAALGVVQAAVVAATFAWQRTGIAGVAQTTGQLANASFAVLFVLLGFGITSLGVGGAAASVGALCITAPCVMHYWRRERVPPPRFERREMATLVREMLPLLASRVVISLLGNIESLVVSRRVSTRAAAVLSLTGRALQVGQSLVNPVAGSVFGGIAHLHGEADRARLRSAIREVMAISTLLTAIIVPVAFSLNEQFVSLWVGTDKFAGRATNLLLLLHSCIVVRLNLVGMMLNALGEMRRPSVCTLVEVAVRAPTLYLLVGVLGVIGAPLANLLTTVGISLWYNSRLLNLVLEAPWGESWRMHLGGLGALVVTTLVAITAQAVLPPATHWTAFALRTILVGALVAGLATGLSGVGRELLRRAIVRVCG